MISTNFLAYRLATALIVLFGVSVLTFGLIYLTPGDPAETVLIQQTDQQPSQEAVDAFRAEHGLNDPIPLQYVDWVAGVFQGDIGQSYYSDRPVSEMIVQHAPATVELAVAAMVVALLIAIPTGVLSAIHRGERLDVACQLGALVGVSMPNFWLGYLLIIVFSLHLGLFPVSGSGGLENLVLPAVALGTGMAAIVTRLVRTAMLEELDRAYVDAVRSKGLGERIVIYKHALRNALIPVVTVVGLQFGFVLNGAVVIEIVFQRPGLGTLLVDAIFARDYPVVQGVVLVTAVAFVLTNLLVDLSYRYLDPRIRLGGVSA
ncbi:ABC transporter permease [Halobacteria archaeon AArc-m2/3/4]|uniref:ABC transporter permease n=1 Tax=Natronoglomus mannanivorans TaxID=2979990 RepID=A0AAP3E2K2_9EURY|nr:ABC transporter permease [Halobacteria archaeon AArc-xg1-1]MCU4973487.1 ABC transporter permease [Halobacteria archaeon AArc-m2/3/4]